MLEGAGGVPFVTCPDVVDGPPGPGLPLPSQVSLSASPGLSPWRAPSPTPTHPPSPQGSTFQNLPLTPAPPLPPLRGIKSVAAAAPRGILGTFYLRPTCVGLSTTRTFTVLNGSRLPCRFKVRVERDKREI